MVNSNLARAVDHAPIMEIGVNEQPVKWCSVSLSDVMSRGKRLEASVYDVEAKQARSLIYNGKHPVATVGGKDGLTTSYVCGRFKRVWVEKSDMPIFQPSTIVDIKPTPDGYISKRTHTDIDALRVHKGQILMTCSGTIGKVSFVSDTLDGKIFSHDLLRINCIRPEDAGYIYAYLKSAVGNKILLTNSYGAVITHIEPEHLSSVPIPDAPAVIKNRMMDCQVKCNEVSKKTSKGVRQPRHLRGLRLIFATTASISPSETLSSEVYLGKYWRSRPLVFSFVPRCQGEYGSAK